MALPRVEVLYCDDIRQEVGNKRSFIGIYFGELAIPSFPFVLQQLCIFVKIVIPSDFKPGGLQPDALELCVGVGDRSDSIKQIFSSGVIDIKEELAVADANEEVNTAVFTMQITLSPFEIDEEFALVTYVKIGEETIYSEPLNIKRNISNE